MAGWNPWHGCHKKSEGCANCYVYRIDAKHGRDSSVVQRTAEFDLPVRRGRDGNYKIAPGELVWTCFSSDFLVEDADIWRSEAWDMIRERRDLEFLFLTKRPERIAQCVPSDWGEGWPNVTIGCTVENQKRAQERMPVFLEAPVRRKILCCEPLLGPVDLSRWLGPWIDRLIAGGESGEQARVCDYSWILSLRAQCNRAGVGFYFKQTGANFCKDGKLYRIRRKDQHTQALRAGINTVE